MAKSIYFVTKSVYFAAKSIYFMAKSIYFMAKSVYFMAKSIYFTAKSIYFIAAHAAQRQNQFDLWLIKLTLRPVKAGKLNISCLFQGC